MAPTTTLFGHQDALAYGVLWKTWHKSRSDVHDVCGKYPAVFGWELGFLGKSAYSLDSVKFEALQEWIREVYRMGGINTISWHMDNFVTGNKSWDTTGRVVRTLLPGGSHHTEYVEKLDQFAEFVKPLKTGPPFFRKAVPVIFRPFHEHTGSWFWWGQPHCTPEEYKALWRFTVEYLRDKKRLHQIIYAYSTDIFRDESHYLECYPGDAYVDVLGMDDYHDVGPHGRKEDLVKRLRMLVKMADERRKIAALTETGREAIPEPHWWTQTLLEPIKADPVASRIAWILVWRNYKTTHHYAPYPGHVSVPDFLQFSQDPAMSFCEDLPPMYRK
jgi:mannan endo-1,4-beta-mannosidase